MASSNKIASADDTHFHILPSSFSVKRQAGISIPISVHHQDYDESSTPHYESFYSVCSSTLHKPSLRAPSLPFSSYFIYEVFFTWDLNSKNPLFRPRWGWQSRYRKLIPLDRLFTHAAYIKSGTDVLSQIACM
ncbi:predicted protein [Botrytis cinerea T4]|uniref:Uncharacterized protein n=1 Tax=Botryotinia fuckeliana (strain T4) TaxID=999810 RepID=G2YTA5_BOTF4|nr:predicted protein [Botrytis cinerea T4]